MLPTCHSGISIDPSGTLAEFDSEQYLELFFWNIVLPKVGLKPLARQHSCLHGICDILAITQNRQLVIIELKNTKDTNIIEQLTNYFDAIIQEKPFSENIDYTKSILLYAVSPSYGSRTKSVLKYHKLNFSVLTYQIQVIEHKCQFQLSNWLTQERIAAIEIEKIDLSIQRNEVPKPSAGFTRLLSKSSPEEVDLLIQMRNRIYHFSHQNNYKITESTQGFWTRFQRTKNFPIIEIGFMPKHKSLQVYLWLPFTTINGHRNSYRNDTKNYQRTSMMRIWLTGNQVNHIGYIDKGRKSWLIVTSEDLEKEGFSQPTKLKFRHGNDRYWKGLAMPREYYLTLMDLPEDSKHFHEFLDIALDTSLRRFHKSNHP
jgi:hypothetical protein